MAYAAVDDLDVYHELHGDGPLLVLVMGLGVDHRAWLPHVEDLAQDHTCLIYDQRGVGATRERATGARPRPPYSISGFADDLAGLVRAVGLGPGHICGVSMGGAIAMDLAGRHPDVVATLALHATWHRTDAFLKAVFELREPILHALGPTALQRYVGLWAWAPQHWERQFGAQPVADTAELISQGDAERWTAEDVECYLGHLHAAIRHDASGLLGAISAPTLVTVGDADILTERRFADAMVSAIPGAELQVIAGAGHAYCFEDPPGFRALMRAWLARHADRQPS